MSQADWQWNNTSIEWIEKPKMFVMGAGDSNPRVPWKACPAVLSTGLLLWLRQKEKHPHTCCSCPKQVMAGEALATGHAAKPDQSLFQKCSWQQGTQKTFPSFSILQNLQLLLKGRAAQTDVCTRAKRCRAKLPRDWDKGESLQEQSLWGKGYSPGVFILLLFLQLAATIHFWSSSSAIHGWEYCHLLSCMQNNVEMIRMITVAFSLTGM